ncbi:DUF3775 domain-containing protein [Bradyrhizobium canariense]|uniref:DUF3775 domain-containing protein n=1 Tax=Bradyrhizobium canariense TaxID=255045 RepID=UPI001B8A5317|nr:DUF3775 domain-containing protein [Bradyrhizobium canariense]
MSHDPFFTLPPDGTWNACIGQQGDELHYLDGYIEAAWELADAVIQKNMLGRRDTLVLPILYNARHAVELLLKYVTNQLVKYGALAQGHPANHDIRGHYDQLVGANIGDEKLREGLAALEPFIASLTRIDGDGQELRYHLNRDGDVSLKDEPLANIAVIRISLRRLASVIDGLKHRTIDFVEERGGKAYTDRCSRSDLVAITAMLPPLAEWKTDAFTAAKEAIKKRFNLGSKHFTDALNVIKANREMKGRLGGESEPLSLTDAKAVRVIEEWRKLHPPRDPDAEPAVINGADISVEDLMEGMAVQRAVLKTILQELTGDEIAELETLYYLGRDGYWAEQFDDRIAHVKRKQAAEQDLPEQLRHLVDKTNLLQCLQIGARKAGRLALSGQLEGL